jgi:hypothetical protein
VDGHSPIRPRGTPELLRGYLYELTGLVYLLRHRIETARRGDPAPFPVILGEILVVLDELLQHGT